MFRRRQKVKGRIREHGLVDWWLNSLSDEDRRTIEELYNPMVMGSGNNPSELLTQTDLGEDKRPPIELLGGLLGWLHKPEYFHIAEKLIQEGMRNLETGAVMDKHFFLQQKIEVYYRNRDEAEGALKNAIHACKEQIALAPEAAKVFRSEYPNQRLPVHRGFEQLRIIRKKQKDYKAVLETCQQAKAQGWNGNWDKEIERAKQALAKGK